MATAGDYVAALLFSEDKQHLVLELKDDRLDVVANKLNGPGGKIEVGETAADAISRETYEETGVLIPPGEWEEFLTLVSSDGSREVVFFRAFSDQANHAKTMEKERVDIYALNQLQLRDEELVPDLQWIIPLALDKDLVVPLRITCSRVKPKSKS